MVWYTTTVPKWWYCAEHSKTRTADDDHSKVVIQLKLDICSFSFSVGEAEKKLPLK